MSLLKKILLNIILVIGLFVFILLTLEIGIRIFYPVTRPRMIVEKASPLNVEKKLAFVKPLFEGTFQTPEYSMQIKTNSEGFRDIEHKLAKPEGTFRIIAIGDSYTFGWGIAQEEAYPQIMQDLLNEKSIGKQIRYEVFNMSVANIGTLEELEILEYGLRYNPDLILLGLLVEDRWNPQNGNDLCDNLKSWHKSQGESLIKKGQANLSLRFKTKFIGYLNSLHYVLAKNSNLYFLIMVRKGTSLRKNLIGLREGLNQDKLELGWKITKQTLKKINSSAKRSGAEFVIIRIPFTYNIYTQEDDRANKILAQFGQENNINICELLSVLRKNKDKDLYYPADGHWKRQAHLIVAEETLNFLVGKNLIGEE